MRKIKVVVFNPQTPRLDIVTIENKLQNYYDIIGCDFIDITRVRDINIICDDEGLLLPKKLSYVEQTTKRVLVGTLIFTGVTDEDGNFTDISEEQIHYLNTFYLIQDLTSNNYFLYNGDNKLR